MRKIFFNKTLVYLTIFILIASILPILSFNTIADPDLNKDTGENEEVCCFVEGVGNYFEISSSPYLNIILESVEVIDIYLESVPKIVDFSIQKGSVPSTEIIISGFELDKEYYHYEDGNLINTFFADENNCYFFIQDLTIFHHVEFKEGHSTVYIHSDGTIDPITAPLSVVGNIYEMTDDIYDEIIIEKSGIIFDGKGHTVYGTGINYGIYVNDGSNWINDVTIKNVIVDDFISGIRTFQAYDIRIFDNEAYNCISGIRLQNSDNCIVKNNYIDIFGYGIDIREGSGSHIIEDNTLVGSSFYFTVDGSFYYITAGILNAVCPDNIFINNDLSGIYRGFWVYTSYVSIFTGNDIKYCVIGLYLQDSQYSKILHNNFYDIDYEAIDCYWGSDNSIISGNVMDSSTYAWYYGINLYDVNNILVTNNIIEFSYIGIWSSYEVYDITFYHNSFINNYLPVLSWDLISMTTWTWDNGAGEGNYWNDYPGSDDGSNGRTAGDGVGDTQIPHPQSSYWAMYGYYLLDNYPLMLPYPTLNIEIDIKPGSYPNSINVKSKGKVPVAILSTDNFYASVVDPESIMFLGSSPMKWAMEDVDEDGDIDMILHFKTKDLNFELVEVISDEEKYAELTAETLFNYPLVDKDSVRLLKGDIFNTIIYNIIEKLVFIFPNLQRLIQ